MPLYAPLNPNLQEIRLLTIHPRKKSKTNFQVKPTNVLASSGTSYDRTREDSLRDTAIAQLMGMGFSLKRSRRALDECGNRNDLSASVDWLLNHPETNEESSSKAYANSSGQITGILETAETTKSYHIQDAPKTFQDSMQFLMNVLEQMEVSNTKTTVECSMKTVSLWSKPSFVALSYTWGDPGLTKTIEVNGQTTNVTTNLSDALLRLRKDEQPVTIWADAICIDQGNDSEKSAQVCLMKSIYEKAASVAVWLGPSTDDSDNLIAAVNDIGKQALAAGIFKTRGKEFQKIFHGPEGTILSVEQKAIKESIERLSRKVGLNFPFRALTQFALRPYWNRVWIIQEIAVPREVTVFCGRQDTSFSRLAATVLFVLTHNTTWFSKFDLKNFMDLTSLSLIEDLMACDVGGITQHIGNRRKYHLDDTGETGPGMTLFELLTKTCLGHENSYNKRATNPRDIIYGVVGMASDFKKLGIVPDYSKEIEGVCTDATRGLLRLGYMGILAWSQQHDQRSHVPNWPSWVPDFTRPILKPCYDEIHYDLFSASGKHRYVSRASPLISSKGPNILALSCFKIDKIQNLGGVWPGGNWESFAHIFPYLHTIENFCSSAPASRIFRKGCVVTDRWEEAPWRIPSGDLEMHGSRYRGTEAMHRDYLELKTYVEGLVPGDKGTPDKLSKSCNMYRLALEKQYNRRPFTSLKGYVGLVPALSENGDIICIVEGANSPFVFRNCGDVYELVGEAYVYGIMDGEFMESGPPMEILHVR